MGYKARLAWLFILMIVAAFLAFHCIDAAWRGWQYGLNGFVAVDVFLAIVNSYSFTASALYARHLYVERKIISRISRSIPFEDMTP